MAGKRRLEWDGDLLRPGLGVRYSEADWLRRRLAWGQHAKAVFVRGAELQVFGVCRMAARQMELRRDWSLAGVYWPNADIHQVLADIAVTREEQQESRDVMRNEYVRG